ncbi:TnsA endonuclease N-terminal domain-containing protein [Azospirillum sp. TSO22-1]|uniref:TnsA endonuclease N-terminal domain-containing protein n=1 Tax=Azospirillum sp. TSO22-1 TaxID=716789 RepID=UPI000D656A49|nr:TnsA endonuclease N-terminal domain-containing protein [Azospirillum sp. TSO22-1]
MPDLSMSGTRARRVITRSVHRVKGRFPSLKMGRTIHWESQLERDLIYLLEFDPDVQAYREQPTTLSLVVDGKSRRYTPDFLVQKPHGFYVVEVKPAEKARQPEYVALFAAATTSLQAMAAGFQILTEVDIRAQPRLDNIRLLLRYQRVDVPERVWPAIAGLLADGGKPAGVICDALADVGVDMATLAALTCRHRLHADLNAPFDTGSLLCLSMEI